MFRTRLLSMLLCSFLTSASCQHAPPLREDVVLKGYSDENYSSLDRAVGGYVCIVGQLTADADFLLQPVEDERGIVNFGPSRVFVSLRDENNYARINDSHTYRVCGQLLIADIYPGCEEQQCKNYDLRRAILH